MTAATIDTATRPLTLTELAVKLGRSYPYVFNLWKSGKIDSAYKLGRTVVVPPCAVEQLREYAATR